ncbi:MAG: YCF48-related protein [Ignavibacteria bacterium]|nr:YCF48-related protein [Ignavibacteria bacterium]
MRTLKIFSLVFILSITIPAQWVMQNSGTQLNLNSIFFIDSNTGWAVGDEGIILKTTNGGNDWITQPGVTTDNLYSVHFENSNIGWIVGENVRIMKSTDGGSSWSAQFANPPFPVDLRSVQFQNLNEGWAVGHYIYSSTDYDSYIIKTTNGGTSWQNNWGFMDEKLFSVFFVNGNLGLVAGSEIARTTDGGFNWFSVFGSFMDEFYSVFFIDSNIGWIAGKNALQSKGLIYKSANGGLNWSLLRSDTLKTYTSVFFADADHGWVAGLGGNILYTPDGGIDWSYQPSGTASNLSSIFFTDNITGWAAGSNGTILKTNNGGTPVELLSFTSIVTRRDVILTWITATETNNQGFEILRSIQNNDEWNKIGIVPGHGTTTESQHYSFTDNNVSPGKYQYKLKQIDYDGTFEYSQIVEVEIPFVNKFSLSQNYPNPFNPSTKIQYSVSITQNVTLKVCDILGIEVATLVNEEKQSREYEVEFNGSNLPSGIYFYQLKAGDPSTSSGQGFVATKKMILIK